MNDRESVYQAIAHPVRRDIIDTLSDDEAANGLPIGEISDRFEMSRQAVTRHIRLLEEAGLLRIEQAGRQRLCHANPEQLAVVYRWVSVYRQYWTEKLDALGTYLDRQAVSASDSTSDS
ncbi:MAG: helix-turn-helix transcriptional regulator [Rhodothermales bacterium]|nr:helix-turn-helix transcriptional regulator [Rhodothermales bacterium]